MKIEREFVIEKETKNCYRFIEQTNGQPPVIKTIYIQKWAFKRTPTRIKVIVEWED